MNRIREIRTRLSWLVVGLAVSLLIAKTISGFEDVLNQDLTLAAFIPLVVYMSDAVGTQMEAIIIRELNVRKKKFNFIQFLRRQASIVLPVSLIIGVLSGISLELWRHDSHLSLTIGLSLMAGILTSLITGALMPYMFWRLHKDPAEASGPVATVTQDFLSIVTFFLIAKVFI
ncbi:magnesium transporter [Candidatus Saccharibacteria bacterium]|nr:magnesium transporter [Candidatus Saccharibacteria bacterium]